MRVNENLQAPIGTPPALRQFLYDTLQLFARAINRRAVLDSASRTTAGVDTTDDIIVDSDTSGLVLKDSAGHYWRVTINTSGSLITTDLGTTKP